MAINKSLEILLTIITIAIVNMSTSIYLPSLPSIVDFFHIKYSTVQLTISFNLLGLAISSLIYGPLSDHYGRRPTLLIGITIFTIGSILCCFATTITSLIFYRLLQGFGAGSAVVISYSTIKDLFSIREEQAKIMSRMSLVIAIVPAISPILGSFVLSHGYHWYSLFIITSIFSLINLILLIFKFNETMKTKPIEHISLLIILRTYNALLKNYKFLGFISINALTFMFLWSYNTTLPFILIKEFNIEAHHYGYYTIVGSMFYIIGNIFNQINVTKYGTKKMISLGIIISITVDIIALALPSYIENSALLTVLTISPLSLGIALIFSNNTTHALNLAGINVGTASAFIFFIQMTIGSLGSYLSTLLYSGSINYLIVINITLCCITTIIYTFYQKYTLAK